MPPHLESVRGDRFPILWSYYPGVVTALLKLHHHINEPGDAALNALTQCTVVLGQDPPEGRYERTQLWLSSV